MISETAGLLGLAGEIARALLSAGLVLCFIRLVLGPSLPDRIVALDLIATLAVGIIAVETIATNQPLLLRPAIVLALLAFLGTVAFARYIEKGSAQ